MVELLVDNNNKRGFYNEEQHSFVVCKRCLIKTNVVNITLLHQNELITYEQQLHNSNMAFISFTLSAYFIFLIIQY